MTLKEEAIAYLKDQINFHTARKNRHIKALKDSVRIGLPEKLADRYKALMEMSMIHTINEELSKIEGKSEKDVEDYINRNTLFLKPTVK